MTNLTDLLPAGAGGKQVSFTASGAISSGQAVVLNSDGTVGTIGVGSETVVAEVGTSLNNAVFDGTSNKVIAVYADASSSDAGTAAVGTISGASISFGTPVVFEAGVRTDIAAIYDSSNGKVVLAYSDKNNSNYGTAVVGTVSGTSISFGTPVVFRAAAIDAIGGTFDSTNNKIVLCYRDNTNSSYGTAVVGTVSGTSISFGTPVVYNSGTTTSQNAAFDSSNGKVVIGYRDSGNLGYATAIVGTVSGTSISFGSEVVFMSATGFAGAMTFDSTNNKVVFSMADTSDSSYGKAIVGTVSGTSISFGSLVTYENSGAISANELGGATFDPDTGKCVFIYTVGTANKFITGTVSGTSMTFDTATTIDSTASASAQAVVYDTNVNTLAFFYRDSGNSSRPTGRAFVSSSGFIGIADAAISDTASGNITIKGGVASNTDISTPLVVTVNTASTFLTSTPTGYAQAYDPDNNKALIIGRSGNIPHSYVATVSGTSISYGSLVYPAGTINANFRNQSLTYDTNANKFVFCYQDNSNSSYGTAVVGTLSGTSTTWGTPVVYASVNSGFNEVVYDSNAQKVAVFYKNQSASNQGVAIVGTVSGTSISFGSSTDFLASNTNDFALAYDTNAQKIFVAVTDFDASLGRAYVATISGTSISFGTPTTFLSGVVAANSLAAAYDSTNQKCILAYTDDGPDEGYMVVGTISGTSVSFGSTTQYGVSSSQKPNMTCMAYDATNQLINVIYNESGVGVRTTYASVSGTSVTVESDTQVIASTSVEDNGNLYDPDNGNIIAVYTDYANTDGVSSVVTTSDTLVPNSTYYVQSDGSLSTTSSSVTAGKALSATSINLDYSS